MTDDELKEITDNVHDKVYELIEEKLYSFDSEASYIFEKMQRLYNDCDTRLKEIQIMITSHAAGVQRVYDEFKSMKENENNG